MVVSRVHCFNSAPVPSTHQAPQVVRSKVKYENYNAAQINDVILHKQLSTFV